MSLAADRDRSLEFVADSIERARRTATEFGEPLGLRLIVECADIERRAELAGVAALGAEDPRDRIDAAHHAWALIGAAGRVRRLIRP